MDNSLIKFHMHVKSVVGKASNLSNNLLSSTLCWSLEFMQALFKVYIRPILDYCSCVWNTC